MNVYSAWLREYRTPFAPRPGAINAPWLFTMLAPDGLRNDLMAQLKKRGIETRPAFIPLHRQFGRIFEEGQDSHYPVASAIADRGISLPTHANMTTDDALYIAKQVLEILQ